MSGRVRARMSLLPFSGWSWSLNGAPRKSASSRPSRWIITPQAPSSTRMRSLAAAFRAAIRSVRVIFSVACRLASSVCSCRRPLAHAQHPADRIDQLGPVQGVEVEVVEAVFPQPRAGLGGDGGGDQPPGLDVVVEAVEQVAQPAGD